jgi:hypothetical protein
LKEGILKKTQNLRVVIPNDKRLSTVKLRLSTEKVAKKVRVSEENER